MTKKTIPLAIAISLLSLMIFWLPFILKINHFWGISFGRSGMETIVQNFDGLNFLVVAKSLYNPDSINAINRDFLTGNEPVYFSAHFPIFALITRIFGTIMSLPKALIVTILLSNVLLAYALGLFFRTFVKNSKLIVVLTILTLFFPARMLSVRAVGSNEPIFMFFVLMSLISAHKNKDWQSGGWGALAVLTRSPGILLFGAYATNILLNFPGNIATKFRKLIPYLLMPACLGLLFTYYGYTYGDFLAYFHSGDNLHLFFPPFTIFSNMQSWISDMWREDIVYAYLFYASGLILIPKEYKQLRMFGLIYGLTLLMVAHRDLARYALPLSPLVWLGYEKLLDLIPRKYLSYALMILIPIYLLGWQFVLKNVQPINNWQVFL